MHHRSLNEMTKWVVSAFLSGILTVLGFMLVLDRARIVADTSRALVLATANDKNIAVMQTTLDTIDVRLKGIEVSQKEILAAVQ